MGVNIYPEMASEFYNYLQVGKKVSNGVLLSQSGRSTEVLWCAELFERFTAITNYSDSSLCKFSAAENVIPMLAGVEKYSSSKTYINTLLALFKGFGININSAVQLLCDNEKQYEQKGKEMADAVFDLLQKGKVNGLYITGSGPNIGTALQAALIMSESTKLNFNGLPMAQYDHGPKETAKGSVVINILSEGKSYERTKKLVATIAAAGAHVFTVEEKAAAEYESIIHNIVPFNYMAYYLSQLLNVKDTFLVGGKVTEVNIS
jgi:glucosamine--fructose-6-phosphate aminotransferase (isomerizing)